MIELKLKEITIREVTIADLAEVARMWDFEKGEISPDDAKKAIEWMQNNHQKNQRFKVHHLCLGIFENKTNTLIGWCGLDGRNNNKTNIFYMIDKKYRQKGYATACAKKILEYGFMVIKLEKIDGGCYLDNIASKKILENIGMKKIDNINDKNLHYYLTYQDYLKI